jgi:hypothetical protein
VYNNVTKLLQCGTVDGRPDRNWASIRHLRNNTDSNAKIRLLVSNMSDEMDERYFSDAAVMNTVPITVGVYYYAELLLALKAFYSLSQMHICYVL